MRLYTVDVTRLGWSTHPFHVMAKSYDEAREKACEKACNHVFADDESEYLADGDTFNIRMKGEPDSDLILRRILFQKKVLPMLLGLDEDLDKMIDEALK